MGLWHHDHHDKFPFYHVGHSDTDTCFEWGDDMIRFAFLKRVKDRLQVVGTKDKETHKKAIWIVKVRFDKDMNQTRIRGS